MDLTNWAGNYTYRAEKLHAPANLDELRRIVHSSRQLRAIGTRHCFNRIADTTAALVSLEHFKRIEEPDRANNAVTLQAGVTCAELCRFLHERGFAIQNTASLLQVSVLGAIMTATHGSGDPIRNLSNLLRAMTIVSADGTVRTLSRETEGERFNGMVVSLGALGVVVDLTIDIVPGFQMAQVVYENLPFDALRSNFNAITASGYSVSLFTDWQSDCINQVWVKRKEHNGRASFDPTFFGAISATRKLHPIASMSAENCTPQLATRVASFMCLPHFVPDGTPSAGVELQAEYFVPRARALQAIDAVSNLRTQIAPLILISEIRTVAADNLWLSPCYRQDSVGIHFTLRRDQPSVERLLMRVESALAPFQPRPHWGKLFCIAPRELQSRYERLDDFRQLADTFDPEKKFRNEFLSTNVFQAGPRA
jgi:alditol oxidase